jgi:hypothetical protein
MVSAPKSFPWLSYHNLQSRAMHSCEHRTFDVEDKAWVPFTRKLSLALFGQRDQEKNLFFHLGLELEACHRDGRLCLQCGL